MTRRIDRLGIDEASLCFCKACALERPTVLTSVFRVAFYPWTDSAIIREPGGSVSATLFFLHVD